MEAIRNPLARTYMLVSAGGLLAAVTVVYLFLYSMFGAVALLVIGLTGIVLRWTVAPGLFLFTATYLLFFPAGLPFDSEFLTNRSEIPDHHFKFADVVFVTAALVHLIGLFRYFSAVLNGMPFEAPKTFVKPGVKPTVRAAEPVSDPELWMLFARAVVFVLIGQLVWLVVTELRLDFRRAFPITTYDHPLDRYHSGTSHFADTSPGLSRFLLSAGFFVSLAATLGFVFWYWRLARMNRDEARLMLVDGSWATHRRDLNRPEKWRGWMKQKLAGTLPKKGCGTYFLVLGLPGLLFLLFIIVIGCAGGFR
jgi:hypothetical protein